MTSAALAAGGFAVAAQLSFNHGWILSLVYPLAALRSRRRAHSACTSS